MTTAAPTRSAPAYQDILDRPAVYEAHITHQNLDYNTFWEWNGDAVSAYVWQRNTFQAGREPGIIVAPAPTPERQLFCLIDALAEQPVFQLESRGQTVRPPKLLVMLWMLHNAPDPTVRHPELAKAFGFVALGYLIAEKEYLNVAQQLIDDFPRWAVAALGSAMRDYNKAAGRQVFTPPTV